MNVVHTQLYAVTSTVSVVLAIRQCAQHVIDEMRFNVDHSYDVSIPGKKKTTEIILVEKMHDLSI